MAAGFCCRRVLAGVTCPRPTGFRLTPGSRFRGNTGMAVLWCGLVLSGGRWGGLGARAGLRKALRQAQGERIGGYALADWGRMGSCRRFGVACGWAGRSRTAPTPEGGRRGCPPPLWIPAGPGFTLPREYRNDGVWARAGSLAGSACVRMFPDAGIRGSRGSLGFGVVRAGVLFGILGDEGGGCPA